MRCVPRLLAFVSLALVCAVPAYSTQYLFQTVTVDAAGLGVPGPPGMNGPSESPSNTFPGTGYGTALYDDAAHTLALSATFSNLDGTTTASHIHAATPNPYRQTAGVATTTPSFAGFPLGVKSGTFSNTLDLTQASSWNPSYVSAQSPPTTAGAEAAFVAALFANKAYWNIHTTTVSGGEIRGFMQFVPEPATACLALFGVAAIGCVTRRRRK
jgi:hypothetical protein